MCSLLVQGVSEILVAMNTTLQGRGYMLLVPHYATIDHGRQAVPCLSTSTPDQGSPDDLRKKEDYQFSRQSRTFLYNTSFGERVREETRDWRQFSGFYRSWREPIIQGPIRRSPPCLL